MFFAIASRDKSSPERAAFPAPTNSRFLFLLAWKERKSSFSFFVRDVNLANVLLFRSSCLLFFLFSLCFYL